MLAYIMTSTSLIAHTNEQPTALVLLIVATGITLSIVGLFPYQIEVQRDIYTRKKENGYLTDKELKGHKKELMAAIPYVLLIIELRFGAT